MTEQIRYYPGQASNVMILRTVSLLLCNKWTIRAAARRDRFTRLTAGGGTGS
jgi:hypothetical protein